MTTSEADDRWERKNAGARALYERRKCLREAESQSLAQLKEEKRVKATAAKRARRQRTKLNEALQVFGALELPSAGLSAPSAASPRIYDPPPLHDRPPMEQVRRSVVERYTHDAY